MLRLLFYHVVVGFQSRVIRAGLLSFETEVFRNSQFYMWHIMFRFDLTRDVIKLALPGLRHLVDWWDLPTRLEWSLAPDRGALGYQTGSLAGRMAFGRLRRPWEQN